jgi:hypothetical protein
MHLRAEQRKQRGVTWGSEQHSRDDWPRAWKHIEPLFGDCDPKTITPEMLFTLRSDIADQVSEGEAYRVIKVLASSVEEDGDVRLLGARCRPGQRVH